MKTQGFASTEITSVTCTWRRMRFYGLFWGRGEEEREHTVPLHPGSDRKALPAAVPALALLSGLSRAPSVRICIFPGASACPGGKSTLPFTAPSPAPCWAGGDTESGLSDPPCFPPGVSGSGAGPRCRSWGCTRAGGAGPGGASPGFPPLPAPPGSCFGGPGSPGRGSSSSRAAPAAPSPAPGASGNEPS